MMKARHELMLGLVVLMAVSASQTGWADDISATLDSTDGSSTFVVNDADTNALLTVQSDGKVGIGTKNPQAAFQVSVETLSQTPLFERGNLEFDAAYPVLRLRASRDIDMSDGFGPGLYFELADIDSTNLVAGVIGLRDGADNKGAIAVRVYQSAGQHKEALRIANSGNVGIGTNAPVEKLHIDGAAVIGNSEASTPVAGTIRWTGSAFEGFDGTHWISFSRAQSGSIVPNGMSFIPAGLFQMGDNYGEGDSDELPVHTVYVSGFYMDKFEVTNQQMADVMQWAYTNGLVTANADTVSNSEGDSHELLDLDDNDSPISFSGGTFSVDSDKGNFPCIEVTWYGALAYCNYKSDIGGLTRCIDFTDWSCEFSKNGYRLPTEAEWEKAARGGLSGQHFPWPSSGDTYSNHIDGTQANYFGSDDPYETDTTPVGYYDGNQTTNGVPDGIDMANGYGLYDMAGNVREWCWDQYQTNWYLQAEAMISDTSGPTGSVYRVVRGGACRRPQYNLRCANRTGLAGTWHDRGFRTARGL